MLTMRQKQALTSAIKKRYQKAGKLEKGTILDEFVASCGYNRSYARRILGGLYTPKKDKRTKHKIVRKRIYDGEVFYPLKTLWVAADGICGKRLKPFIPELLRVLKREKEIKVKKNIEKKLVTVSAATIDLALS